MQPGNPLTNEDYNHLDGLLGDLSVEQFFSDYWQKKPLLVRSAFKDFESPLSGDDLAALSCEPEANARIVIEKDGSEPWQAIHGPMDEDTFAKMPDSHWTLVVNDVEKYLPELSWINDRFRFIPEWFLDDLMVSWAAKEGSVGPHFDLYDVFIIQGSGQRRWQISTKPIAKDNYIPDIALRLIKDFEFEHEWILNPGDMMYLPPGVAHHGVSLGESISYSIGYRATSHFDLVNDFIAHITDNLNVNQTLKLSKLIRQRYSNQISQEVLEQVREIFSEYLNPNHPALATWFGRYVSDPKASLPPIYHEIIESSDDLEKIEFASRNPASRFAFLSSEGCCQLFIDGEVYSTSLEFAQNLCANREFQMQQLLSTATNEEKELLVQWVNQEKIFIDFDNEF